MNDGSGTERVTLAVEGLVTPALEVRDEKGELIRDALARDP